MALRSDRRKLIEGLETLLEAKLLVYFVGDRRFCSAQIAEDVIRPMYDHLTAVRSELDRTKKLALFIYSVGGLMETPWKIVSLLREFSPTLLAIVPFKCYSAATMIVMAADKIIMTDLAQLGPIDPSMRVMGRGPDGQPFPIPDVSVEDIAAYVRFARNRVGIADQAQLGQALQSLSSSLPAPILGQIERTYSHIRLVASKLLSRHRNPPYQPETVTRIIETLTEKSYTHGHGIGRDEAKEIGLDVEYPDAEAADAIWKLYCAYEDWSQLGRSDDPWSYFEEDGPDEAKEEKVPIAIVESTAMVHACQGDLVFRRVRRPPPPNPQINVNLSIGLQIPPPVAEPVQPGQTPQVPLEAIIQQVQQQIMQQVPEIVRRELTRQSPVVNVEAQFRGARWEGLTG
ncbi:MAG: hypothetical protein M1358_08615 [Chloroflexi bacterium]|nr:hypothetical protein [Chloroflexota bacterium]